MEGITYVFEIASFQWLDRGNTDLDQDEMVEFAVVHVGAGPPLVARLRDAGIDASGGETFNVGTQVFSDYSVTVRRRDLAAAAQMSTGDFGQQGDFRRGAARGGSA